MKEVWSKEWVDSVMAEMNPVGDIEWDKCDLCGIPSHIEVIKIAFSKDHNLFACKSCQNKLKQHN